MLDVSRFYVSDCSVDVNRGLLIAQIKTFAFLLYNSHLLCSLLLEVIALNIFEYIPEIPIKAEFIGCFYKSWNLICIY